MRTAFMGLTVDVSRGGRWRVSEWRWRAWVVEGEDTLSSEDPKRTERDPCALDPPKICGLHQLARHVFLLCSWTCACQGFERLSFLAPFVSCGGVVARTLGP